MSYLRQFLACLLVVALCSSSSWAFSPSNVQRTMSGVLQSKMAARGIQSTYPSWVNTLGKVSGALGTGAGLAITYATAAVTAPSWLTLGAVFAVGVGGYMALSAAVHWLVNPDGTVTTAPGPDPNVQGGAIAAEQWLYCYGNVCSASQSAACEGQPPSDHSDGSVYSYSFQNNECDVIVKFTDGSTTNIGFAGNPLYGTGGCVGINVTAVNGVCPPSNFPPPVGKVVPMADAVDALSPEQKAAPVNDQLVADYLNKAWMGAAAVQGYDGVPYDATNPITVGDVDAWRDANPSLYPTVGDFLAPQPAPSGGSAATPFSLPSSPTADTAPEPGSTPSNTTNPASQNPLENLGADPGIGMPNLEPTPTVPMILDPIFNLMPSLRNFVVPQHNGVCPTGTLHLFNDTQLIDAHCDLLESVRPIFSVVMVFVWGFLALIVILSA